MKLDLVIRHPSLLCLGMAGAALASTSLAYAEESKVVTARLRVDAPSDCASASSFWSALSRRTQRLKPSTDNRADIFVDVVVRPVTGGATGDVRIQRSTGRAAPRAVRGASCDEVTQALSLVLALAFDPTARDDSAAAAPVGATGGSGTTASGTSASGATASGANVSGANVSAANAPAGATPPATATPPASAPATATPPAVGSAPATAPAPADARTTTEASPRTTTRSAEAADAPPERDTESSGRGRAVRWRIGAGAHAGVIGLASPGAVVAYGAFAEAELHREGAHLSPSLRAGIVRAEGEASGGGVDAELAWTSARITLCPMRFDVASSLSVRPCIGTDFGALDASAPRLAQRQDRTRPWITPSVTARLSWAPMKNLFVEIEGGATVPLVRDEIAVDPAISLYRAPAFAPSAQVGAGVRFP